MLTSLSCEVLEASRIFQKFGHQDPSEQRISIKNQNERRILLSSHKLITHQIVQQQEGSRMQNCPYPDQESPRHMETS